MWLGRFASVMVTPLPPLIVSGKPVVDAAGAVVVAPVPQAASRATPAAPMS